MVNAYNKHKRWTEEEIEVILHSPLCDREISMQIGRSVPAIQHKRGQLKRGR